MTSDELRKKIVSDLENADMRLLRMLDAVSREYRAKPQNGTVEAPKSQLYRLVYTSARREICDDQCIEEILEASRRNNKPLGITGILIHTQDRFLQVLEGDREKVTQLYNKIAQDPRHGGSTMRFCEPVSKRYFGDWEMAGKKVSSADVDFNTSISPDKKKLYDSMINGDIHSYKDEGMRVLKTFLLFS